MAYLTSIITNIARSVHGKKGVKMTVPLDFMPGWDKESIDTGEPGRQTIAQMKQVMLSMMNRGKKVERKKRSDRESRKKRSGRIPGK
ncbi:unnamed protein product, partial [marine sediment metagenome]